MRNIMEITSCIVEILLCFFYFNGVLGRKYSIGKTFWAIMVIAILINIIRSYLYLSFSINISITVIIFAIISLVGFEGTYSRKIFFVAVNITAILVSEILTALFLSSFLPVDYDDGFTMRYLGMVMVTSILFILDLYIMYVVKRKYRQLPLKFNILMILCPLFSIYLLMLLDTYLVQVKNHNYLLLSLTVFALGYINVMIFNFFDYYEKSLRVTTMDIMLKTNEENYKLLEENEKELHIMRHDIEKHMAEIREMISQNNTIGAKKYVDELNQKVSESICFSRTGNLALDTVLNIEGRRAISSGIKYDIKLNLNSPIHISSVDLSRILYNLIDNAIEACEKLLDKYILISITAEDESLKIIVENTSREVLIIDNKIKTSKKDIKRHGYGIASIKDAVESYDGLVTLSYQDGIFVCRILMKNKNTL